MSLFNRGRSELAIGVIGAGRVGRALAIALERAGYRVKGIARRTPGVKHTVSVSGQSVLLNVNAPNFGTLYVMLDDFPARLAADRSADAIAAKLQASFNDEAPGATVNVFGAPPVDGLGTAGGFKLVIEDPGASEPAELEATGRAITSAAAKEPTRPGSTSKSTASPRRSSACPSARSSTPCKCTSARST